MPSEASTAGFDELHPHRWTNAAPRAVLGQAVADAGVKVVERCPGGRSKPKMLETQALRISRT